MASRGLQPARSSAQAKVRGSLKCGAKFFLGFFDRRSCFPGPPGSSSGVTIAASAAGAGQTGVSESSGTPATPTNEARRRRPRARIMAPETIFSDLKDKPESAILKCRKAPT